MLRCDIIIRFILRLPTQRKIIKHFLEIHLTQTQSFKISNIMRWLHIM